MSAKFLLDENGSDVLWEAIEQFNRDAAMPLDVVRVGDAADLPKSADDASVLRWVERTGRILVSHDRRTLPGHLAQHLVEGGHVPGIFLISYFASPAQIVELLAVATTSENPDEWKDLIEYLA